MANNVMINVPETFDMAACAEQLAELYRAQGFTVNVMNLNNMVTLQFSKGSGGQKHFLGTGLGIKVSLSVTNGTLVVSFSEAAYKDAVIAFFVRGLVVVFLFLVPFIGIFFGCITCLGSVGLLIYGCVNQSSLAEKIGNDVTMLVANQPNRQ